MEHGTPTRAPTALDDAPRALRNSTSGPNSGTANRSGSSRVVAADDALCRTHLSTPKYNFEILASRTVSQAIAEEARIVKHPAPPLEAINPSSCPRFPRFSITTESSQPDLSTDEVISTQISLGEEGIVSRRRSSHTIDTRSSRKHKLQKTLYRAVSSPSLGLRRIGNRIKRAPSLLVSSRRMSKRISRNISGSQAEVARQDADESGTMDINSSPASVIAATADHRAAFKLSDLPEDQTSGGGTAASQGQLPARSLFGVSGANPHLPEVSTVKHAVYPRVMTVNPGQNSREQIPRKSPAFLGRTSSWSRNPNSGLPRSISLGSIDELRCNSFVSSQRRVFSVPTIPSRQSSLVGRTCSTVRRPPRALSVFDVGDLVSPSPLRIDPMFVDIQEGHQVHFVFPPALDDRNPSVSPQRPPTCLKAHSYQSLRNRESDPSFLQSFGIKSVSDETRGRAKIPLFVPSRIIKPAAHMLLIPERQSSRLAPDAMLRYGDAAQDEPLSAQENCSREAPSDASDWSTTVQLGAPKQEVLCPRSEATVAAKAPDESLTVREQSPSKGGKSWEHQRDGQGKTTQLWEDGLKEPAERPTGGPRRKHRGKQALQSCWAYFQRVKQHLSRESHTRADSSDKRG